MVRLGVAGMMPRDMRQVTADGARRIRAAGFTGVSCYFTDPLATEEREVRAAAGVLRAAEVVPAQANAQYEGLCKAEPERRQLGVRQAVAAVRCAAWLGADTLYLRPGSLNERGHWTPHPENGSPATLDRLVDSLRQIARAAEGEGVTLALEGHTISGLDTPERVRDVIDAVDSGALGFNADPVNFISGVADAYHSGALLDRMFAALGDRTVAGHAKDMRLEDRLVVHVTECVPGEGLLDQAAFVRLFAAACPGRWLLIEHLPDEKIPAAKQALDAAAAAAGVQWEREENAR